MRENKSGIALKEKIMRKMILASASPRRRELLEQGGIATLKKTGYTKN